MGMSGAFGITGLVGDAADALGTPLNVTPPANRAPNIAPRIVALVMFITWHLPTPLSYSRSTLWRPHGRGLGLWKRTVGARPVGAHEGSAVYRSRPSPPDHCAGPLSAGRAEDLVLIAVVAAELA